MIVQEVQADISRPRADVYDFVVTHYIQNHPRWDARCIRSELANGNALAVGATGTEVRKQMGRETTYTFRVTELTPDHVTFDAVGGGTTFGAVWAVSPNDNGSRLAITFRIGMGGVFRLFEPLMKGSVRKEMEQAAARIKTMTETA